MRFALIGAAGFVAPKHMAAIKAAGGELVAAYDPHDSVGILDSHFPDCAFFTEFERFDRHIDKLKRSGIGVDYVAVCSPNYLHDAHCRWALRAGADAICEKPLVINARNIDGLKAIERDTGRRIWSVLQLRLHPEVIRAKAIYANAEHSHVDIRYITPRGRWYGASWKGDEAKSGGLAMNIGVHLFDVMGYLFGGFKRCHKYVQVGMHTLGVIELERATVTFNLSTDRRHLPEGRKGAYRSIEINGETFDLSVGFTDLHTLSYAEILSGRGFGIDESRSAIELISELREYKQDSNHETRHQLHHLAPGEKRVA